MPVLGVPYDGSTYFNSGSLYADAGRDTRTGSSARHDVHNLPSFRGGGDPAGAHPRHGTSSITTATPAPVPPATAARPRHGGQPAARYAGSLLESTLGGVINEYYRAAQPSQRTRRSESTRHVSERYKVAGQVFAGGAPSGFSRIQIAWCADSLVHIPASSRGPSLRLHIIATTDQRPGPKVRYCRDPRPMTCTSRRC